MPQQRPHYSANTLRLSERFQKTTGNIGRAATWLVAGSSSPAYLQLDWRTAGPDVVDTDSFIQLSGNKRAGLFMRQWKTAYILSMDSIELEMLGLQYGDAQPAVALRSDSLIQLGTHDDLKFGRFVDTNLQSIAGREGRGPVEVAAGVYSAEAGYMITPTSLHKQAVHVPLDTFELAAMKEIRVI
jgi:hypothetical protein